MEKPTPIRQTKTENTREGPVTFVHDEDGTYLMSYPSFEDGSPDMDRWDEEVPDWRGVVELLLS